MAGMGGSGLAARVIEGVYGLKLPCPLIRINDYDLPAWVNEKTLVICSAFSGTTEEPLEILRQALEKKAKVMTIGAGATIIEIAQKEKIPYYKINPVYNPSKQPRMAVGYSLVGQLVMVSKTGAISITKKEITEMMDAMVKVQENLLVSVKESENSAKQMAKKLYEKKVVFAAARHMMGGAHVVKNQMNENAKNFAAIFDIPELNHHLMEGLRYPDSNRRDLIYIFLESNLYPERIQKRFAITKDVVSKNNVEVVSWKAHSSNQLSQAFEFIQFGSFVNLYLAMLNDLDPAPIPWVDYFKTQLGQSLGEFK